MLKRSDGRWQDQITLPGMSKPKYFYGKTQKEVKQKMAQWRQEQESSQDFETVAQAWLDEREKDLSYNTHKMYRLHAKRLWEHFKGRKVDSIGADEVNAFFRDMANKGYARQTAHQHMVVLSMIFDYAIVSKLATVNPCKAVKLPSGMGSTKREIPTDEQLQKVRDGVHLEFGLFPYMLLYTGLRRGELLALRWEDIDRKRNCIHVYKSVHFVEGSPRIKEPKTESGRRSVVLLDALREVLPEGGSGYIFGGKKPMMEGAMYTAWNNWAGAAGLATMREKKRWHAGDKRHYISRKWVPEITPHQLRHAFATILFDAGVDAKDAQDLLGHASLDMTLGVYTHIRQSRREATANKINRFLSGGGEDGENLEPCQNVVKFPNGA